MDKYAYTYKELVFGYAVPHSIHSQLIYFCINYYVMNKC